MKSLRFIQQYSKSQVNISSTHRSMFKICFAKFIGSLAPAIIPPLHIATLYYFWHEFSRRVDKRYCSCSCWDTVFKGTYESGIASYKHIYFNATANTVKIWVLTVFCIVGFYESVRWLILLLIHWRLRYSMLVLFSSAVFSHYYSWWVYFNYWNDEYYSQWNHQLFFTSTEVLSSILVLYLADNRNTFSPIKTLPIIGIAIVHVVAGSWDQFILNVLQGEGHWHQIVRDVNFMIPDLLHILIPFFMLRRNRRNSSLQFDSFPRSNLRKECLILLSIVTLGLLICSLL